MKNCNHPGCNEWNELSRRKFLGYSGVAAAGIASAPAWLPRTVFAAEGTGTRDVIISIFLRGGADGLTLCVPHFEDEYYNIRPGLNIPRPDSSSQFAAVDLDGQFGLPPAMAALQAAYQANDLAIVHACGSPDDTRSHFDAMRYMEVGSPGAGVELTSGWLGRHLLNTAPMAPNALLRAVGISTGLQQTLAGAPDTLPIADLGDFGVGGWGDTEAERLAAYVDSYEMIANPLTAPAQNTVDTIGLLNQINFDAYQPANGAQYPDTSFGYALKSIAALVKADTGLEAAAVDLSGWDTHEGQGPRQGWMANLMAELAGGLAALHADLLVNNRNVVAVMMSEFGRNAAENGSAGTDHGHGNVMMLFGGGIAGGQVIHQWPGLQPHQLYQGQDLEVTIDFRDVLAEVLMNRVQTPDIGSVFPNYSPTFHGVTT